MFSLRPDLSWLGRLAQADKEEVPGFRVQSAHEQVPGLHNFKPSAAAVPGFHMKAGGPARQTYSDLGGHPFDPLDRPGLGADAFTPVADKPPWGGWECRRILKTTTMKGRTCHRRQYVTGQTFSVSSLEGAPVQTDTLSGWNGVLKYTNSANRESRIRTVSVG